MRPIQKDSSLKLISLRPSILAVALGLSGLAPSAQALSFVFNDASTGGPMTSQQRGAFQAAADFWSSKLSDPVTVYINIAFDSLDPYVLGSTNSNYTFASYTSTRNHLVNDARSALDASAVAHLQNSPALTFLATQGDLSSRLDNDGSANNTALKLTTANAKAMGYSVSTSAANPDATVTIATGYANKFAYTRAGGVPGNKYDFITVAEHEIGHVLGFDSGVDDIDECAGPANKCGLSPTADRFERYTIYSPLDLFRYSAPGTLDVRVGGSPYFSVDGGATGLVPFSTGKSHGNGQQASHFGGGALNLMRPDVDYGQSYDATANDLAAFDAIGWDLATTPVPEPKTYSLLLAGLGVVGFTTRRRARTAAAC